MNSKKMLVKFLAVAFATMFIIGCGGSDSLTAPDEIKPVGNHLVTVAGGQMKIDLSFRDGKIQRLVHNDVHVQEMDASQFTAFFWTGDADHWQSTRQVGYSGGETVTINVPAHDAGNGYFITRDGQRYWLDLGQTDSVGCSVVLQVEHSRHVIVW